ncbi:hypothetical protein [Ilumatobacter nonamiensis]|uniref:hypothetical protein n=1 Tax=Ilumatobacter nonamiensis TaxID=467093 RepID=UPI0003481DA2|nr:hypothetical protein [Ilumatobacter nonamiensis]
MGLFKRRDETREQLEALRSELSTMRQRLDESEGAKARMAEHLGRVELEHRQLTEQVGSVATQVGAVESKVGDVETRVGDVAGSIAPAIDEAVAKNATPDDVDAIRAEVARLGSLAARVDDLSDTISVQRATLPPPTAAPDHDVLAVLQQQLDQLAELIAGQREHIANIAVVATDSVERTDSALAEMRSAIDADGTGQRETVDSETRAQLGLLAERVGAIDSRVNQVSLELTNQLTELSGDVDRAGSQSDVSEAIDDLVARIDDMSGGQERLANEQARYAIQFRNDLAELAERLRRPSGR